MKKLHEADISGEKLTHMTHIEDMLYAGPSAADFAYRTLASIASSLRGDKPESEVKTTCKIDGSPSCIASSDFYGKKFVATKGFFAKDRKIAYTPEDCQNYFGHAPDLARKMTLLLAALDEIRIPTNEIWQGDFLFDAQSLRRDTVDNEECVVFHPNTIVYAVPMKDPLSQVILTAQIGVVWHMRYRGTDFDNLKISFDADANELAETPRAFCTDANLPDFSGQTSFTAEETEQVSSILGDLKAKLADLNKTGILQSIQDDEELQLYLNTFENFEIKSKGTQLAADSATYVSELMDWVAARYDKEIAAKKQLKTQEAYAAKKAAAVAKLQQLEASLRSVIEAQQDIIRIKELIIKKLNIFSSFKTLIRTLDRGYVPVGQEGFAVSDAEGNVQKLVSRLEFSFNNFSKDVIKGWMSDKRQQESTKASSAAAAYERGSGYVLPTDPQLVDITVGSAPWEKHNIDILAGSSPASDEDLELYSSTGKPRSRKPYGEAADRAVAGIGFTFPAQLKAVSDIHFPNQLQGVLNSFGRGVIDDNGKVVLGPIGSSHAGLQKNMTGARRFYFGYSKPDRMVYVVAKNGMDEDFLRKPKNLQIILSNIFDMLRLSVAGGGKLAFYERSNPDVSTLQKAVIQKAKEVSAPTPLIQALNVLDALDIKQIEQLVSTKAEVPGLRADIVKEVVHSNKALENSEYLSLLAHIVNDGLIAIPAKGIRVNYQEEMHKNAAKLALKIGISEGEAIAAVDQLAENLLNMTKPQSGTSVGKGEIMFAMLMKGGAKKVIGDLDINGLDVEVKGIGARMAGSANQGGVESHASTGLKLRAVVKQQLGNDIYDRVPILREPSAFNLNIKGCPALLAVMPLLKGPSKLKFAKDYVQAMMSMAPQAPRANRFEKPMVEALLDGNSSELFLNYIMFHFDAYQQAAGWKMLLLFDDKSHQMILMETPEDLKSAIEKGFVKAMPFGFSSSEEKGTTAEPQKGWMMYIYAPGSNPAERASASLASKNTKLKNALEAKIETLKTAIADKAKAVETISAPAKKAKAIEIMSKYKSQLADFEKQLAGLV